MRILICYATVEGQTRKIARFCADQLVSRGHSVEVLSAADADGVTMALFDAAILAGSVHMGKLQEALGDMAREHASELNRMPTLLLQVSLAAAGDDHKERLELGDIAVRFCNDAGWTPGDIVHVAGAFRFTQYDFLKSWAMRWIASQKGEDVDPHSDTEYTDWEALAKRLSYWPDG